MGLRKGEGGLAPFDKGDGRREYGGQLLEEVWPVARLLELLYHGDDDGVVDALGVDLCLRSHAAGRGRRRVRGGAA